MAKIWIVASFIVLIGLGIVVYLTQEGVETPKVFQGFAEETTSCPNTSDPACFDCDNDGEVGILDFSCFNEVYGESY